MIRLNRPPCPNPTALTSNYKHHANKKTLQGASYGKCMYCEEKIISAQFGDVEHIKPVSVDPSLKFVWENLGFACAKCNNAKNNKYSDAIINPYNENPEQFIFIAGAFVCAFEGNDKGQFTIDIVELNRVGLVEKRGERFKLIQSLVNRYFNATDRAQQQAIKDQLIQEAATDKEYSLVVKSLLLNNQIL